MRQPDFDAESRRLAEEAHVTHYGHALAGTDEGSPSEWGVCPRCGETSSPRVTDAKGEACEGCAERDVEGDVVTSEKGVM